MEPLAANLGVQALCLQYSYEDPPKTIEGMAQALLIVSIAKFFNK